MADETNAPNAGEQKPRVNPAKTGNGDTDKIKLSGQGPTPPKITLRAADQPKKDTTRIELGSARPPVASGPETGIHELPGEGVQSEFYKKSTIRIDSKPPTPDTLRSAPASGGVVDSRSSTIRIDAASTTPPGAGETSQIEVKKTTVRVDQPAGATQPVSQGETARLDVKRSTIRIDNGAGSPGETAKLQGETSRIDVKRTTLRIDQPAGQTQPVAGETSRIEQKKSTIRIDAIPQSSDTQRTGTGGETRRIDIKAVETGQMQPSVVDQQQLKKETTRLEVPAEVIKRQTGRIQVPAVPETPDVFKKRTAQISVPPVVPTSPTVAPAGTESVARPKTIQVRRPPRPVGAEAPKPIAVPPTVAEQTAQARKSETARLDLPKDLPADDRPVTRPKTIRIKRPDGTTARKALTIARPDEGSDEAAEAAIPERLRGPAEIELGEQEPGGVWAVLALVALLVVCTVIYVLLAQTFAPNLPFPGKIG